MRFEWDEEKRASNLRKHGIDFVDAEEVFDGPTLTIEMIGGTMASSGLSPSAFWRTELLLWFTESSDLIRVISIRKATRSEEKAYFSSLTDGLGSGRSDER